MPPAYTFFFPENFSPPGILPIDRKNQKLSSIKYFYKHDLMSHIILLIYYVYKFFSKICFNSIQFHGAIMTCQINLCPQNYPIIHSYSSTHQLHSTGPISCHSFSLSKAHKSWQFGCSWTKDKASTARCCHNETNETTWFTDLSKNLFTFSKWSKKYTSVIRSS